MSDSLTLFVCQECGRFQPCILVVPGDVLIPDTCPWNGKKPKWKAVLEGLE